MKATVPGSTVGLLTVTSKMPCDSWSIPAGRACPGAYYGENGRANVDKSTICGHCYAQKGMYAWPDVANAQETRFQWLLQLQRNGEAGIAEFVRVMVPAVQKSAAQRAAGADVAITYVRDEKTGKRLKRRIALDVNRPTRPSGLYFRIHDSGDFYSPWYVRAWHAVAVALPDVQFWAPTRSWRMKNETMQAALRDFAALPNVILRPSALFFNAPAPRIPGYAAGSTASDADFTCPASRQEGYCGDCRTCWSPDVEVSYAQH